MNTKRPEDKPDSTAPPQPYPGYPPPYWYHPPEQEGSLFDYWDVIVKHKILDAIGDLYLLGHSVIGSFSGYKSGHQSNNALLRALLADEDAYEIVSFDSLEQVPISFSRPIPAAG